MAKLIIESYDKPNREDYDSDEDHKADLIDWHQREHDFHKGQHDYHSKSEGWNLQANIYNRDWKQEVSKAKKMMKYHQDEIKKLKGGK